MAAPSKAWAGTFSQGTTPATRISTVGREIPFARAAELVGEVAGGRLVSENTSDRIVKQAGRAARAIVEAETARPYAAPARTRRAWDNAATAHTMIDLLCEASA